MRLAGGLPVDRQRTRTQVRRPPAGGLRTIVAAWDWETSRGCSHRRRTRSACTRKPRRSNAQSRPFRTGARSPGSSGTSQRRSRGTNAANPPARVPAPEMALVGMGRRRSRVYSKVVRRPVCSSCAATGRPRVLRRTCDAHNSPCAPAHHSRRRIARSTSRTHNTSDGSIFRPEKALSAPADRVWP